ncbi:hypothetical protein LAZ67_15001632 [Cordylochernes scorpioides]|uniref:Uncharacterized protein n=1 Tax=Cordylochernes scorpioides TaxID=51811 RepID=A0ABY6L8W3_9ARAC|nr:hypothetical protein LAZ67_15001632 [Cordylochernes scorpioides]
MIQYSIRALRSGLDSRIPPPRYDDKAAIHAALRSERCHLQSSPDGAMESIAASEWFFLLIFPIVVVAGLLFLVRNYIKSVEWYDSDVRLEGKTVVITAPTFEPRHLVRHS